MYRITTTLIGSACLLFGGAALSYAQDSEDGEETTTLSEFVEDFEPSGGLFPLYQNAETGEVYMEIGEDQLDQEFIYFLYTENGPVDAGQFRGQFRDNRIVMFKRYFDRIEIEAVNTSFSFDEDSALSRAADANISRAPIANVPIVSESEAGDRLLISADAFLEKEALHQITPWSAPGTPPGAVFKLGKLSSEKTRITEFSNFPANTDVRVEYVYDNPTPINYGGQDVTDARSVAILAQHSFIEMPEDGFEPRRDDFRVGYFSNESTDLTSPSHTPYNDVINRWRLEKKDPDAAVSDPVKPITLWIENTTPVELREMIRDASLAWNPAFEAAGISNAIEVKVQPDDADWDAGDIRYNVMRWTSSPRPPFGGYGPSFTNPRTGEIIGADIMLEYIFLTNRMKASQAFDTAALPSFSNPAAYGLPAHACSFSTHLQHEMMTARAVMMAQGASVGEVDALVKDGLYYLILHEIGHTLGLTHNMRSSSTVALEDLHKEGGVSTNSVMDYPAINLASIGEPQGQYSISAPGAYDIWAIQYGYMPEDEKLDALLARSTEPQLAYGNDADDLRAPGIHIDPRVMISDLSDDPITWAAQRVKLVDETLPLLSERMLEEGGTYQPLYNAYMLLTGQRAGAAIVASRWVGGVYNNRAAIGQEGAEQPLIPVPASQQRRALAVLNEAVFAPDAFKAGEDLLAELQVQRRGFNSYGVNIDPRPHARALSIQGAVLSHLLHPNVLTRLTDTRRYGGDYPVSAFMSELTGIVFEADERTSVNTYRQNLQIDYTARLIAIASGQGGGSEPTPWGPQSMPEYDHVSRSAALASLERIKRIAGRRGPDDETRAHRAHLRSMIEQFERR